MNDVRYWIGFNIVPGIGPARFQALLDTFGEAGTAWHANVDDLRAAGLDRRSLESLLAYRAKLDLDAELEKIRREEESLIVRVSIWTQERKRFSEG